MFARNRLAASTAIFYNESPKEEELYCGYLHKSPALSSITKGMGKAWRRRFFVLHKTGEHTYHLAYYRNHEKRGKPLRKINLSKVSLICTCPEKHHMWDWIQKNFKCSSSSVLFLRVNDFMIKSAREYFLIGENSEEVDRWDKEIQKGIRISGNKVRVTDDSLQQDTRVRAISEPTLKSPVCDEGLRVIYPNPFRLSEPVFPSQTMPCSHYDVPSNYAIAACKLADDVCSDDDDDDDNDTEENPESPEDISEYMNMASLKEVLQNHLEDDACLQTNTPTKGAESSQDLCDSADHQKMDNPMRRNSAELRCAKGSLSDFNGNYASTETNISETQTPIEKEICVKLSDLNKSLILTQKQGKLCVSEYKQTETSHLFHKGDQILAFNDLLIETEDEIHAYLKKLNKDEVKLTIRRYPGSRPFPCFT